MQLIDKDALVAEIERIKKEDYYDIHDEYDGFVRNALDKVLLLINTLEVKEMDLEKELSYEDYIGFFEDHPNFPDDWGYDEARVFAEYFFKLGLKAQKGE